MMTRKDYVETAHILYAIGCKGTVRAVDYEWLVKAFADMFEADNDRFDRQRFIAACNGM